MECALWLNYLKPNAMPDMYAQMCVNENVAAWNNASEINYDKK